jgi:hypothetical protein
MVWVQIGINEFKYEEWKSSIRLGKFLLVYGAKTLCTSPVVPWCVSFIYTLGYLCPMNVWNICRAYTDIGCTGQHCREVPPSTMESCNVVVVRGNSK